MIYVFKGLKLRVAAAIISAIILYGALTFIISIPTQTLAAKESQRALAPRTTVNKTAAVKMSIPKPSAEVGAEAYEGFVEKEPVSEYRVLVQNLLISAVIALTVMAIFRMRMR